MEVSLTELEEVINYWRLITPSTGEECALSPEVNALASVYALMIYHRHAGILLTGLDAFPRRLIDVWLSQQVPARTLSEG